MESPVCPPEKTASAGRGPKAPTAGHSEPDEFRSLLAQVERGSPEAASTLVDRYGPHILRAVRRRLNQAIRTKFDSSDFVQAVWASFFAAPRPLAEFQRPDELVHHLLALARNKVVDEIRRRLQSKTRSVNREHSLDDSRHGWARRLAAAGPSPSDVAMAREMWTQLIQGRPEQDRRILELHYQGYSSRQIADQLKVSRKTVDRAIDKFFYE